MFYKGTGAVFRNVAKRIVRISEGNMNFSP